MIIKVYLNCIHLLTINIVSSGVEEEGDKNTDTSFKGEREEE